MPAHLAVCWGENITFFAHLWRLFKVRQYTANRKALASELTRRVAENFVPVL